MFKLQHLDHVAITVSDMARSIEWYAKTLGLERKSPWDGDPQLMCSGDTCVALFSASGQGEPMSDSERRNRLTMRHFAFRTDRVNFERAQEEFRGQGIEFEFADHGVCHSVYITDPDEHLVEITTYEV
jgi:catechol 2,3-dioxygenase-like lactoylglutathione lyase family enzyme